MTRKQSFARWATLLAVLIATAHAALVHAADDAATGNAVTPASAADTTVLPEVKVNASSDALTTEGSCSYTTGATTTATGLNLSIRETPQSVTVVTRERIEDQHLQTITDVVNSVTGVTAKAFDSSRSGFTARGFDTTNLQIDGIPTTWDAGWSAGETKIDTAIYDRVEVVRGATGLLTGAGNPSAAINLVRKHADGKLLTGSVSLETGSWDARGATVDVSSPINEGGSVRGRFVGSYRKADSCVDLAEEKREVLYGVVEADLTAATLVRLGVSRQEDTPKGSIWGGLPAWFSDGTRTDWDRSKTSAADWSSWASVQQTYFANLEHRLGNDWLARVVFNHGVSKADAKLLFAFEEPSRVDGSGMFALPSRFNTDRKQDDIGLQVSGPFEMLGREHELSLGASLSEQKFTAWEGALALVPIDNFLDWNGAAFPEPAWVANSPTDQSKTTQNAVYGAARFSVNDVLRAITGLRITEYEKKGATSWSGAYRLKERNVLTPYAGLIYDLDETYSAYVSYTGIFNPQNYQDRDANYLDPTKGKAYEAGLKGEYYGGKLNVGLTVFRIDQDNVAQIDSGQIVPGSFNQAYYAAQGTRSDGFELDVAGELSPGWSLSVGWAQFIARDGNGTAINTSHPRKTLKLFTRYRLPGDWSKLTIGGGVNWESENYTLTTNPVLSTPEKLEQKAYALVSLMTRYDISKVTSLQLNVDNLLDEKYYSQIGFYNQLAYGMPRNAMMTLRHQF